MLSHRRFVWFAGSRFRYGWWLYRWVRHVWWRWSWSSLLQSCMLLEVKVSLYYPNPSKPFRLLLMNREREIINVSLREISISHRENPFHSVSRNGSWFSTGLIFISPGTSFFSGGTVGRNGPLLHRLNNCYEQCVYIFVSHFGKIIFLVFFSKVYMNTNFCRYFLVYWMWIVCYTTFMTLICIDAIQDRHPHCSRR